MLADILVARSAYGGDRGRDDLHRHATFSYGFRSGLKRFLRLFRRA